MKPMLCLMILLATAAVPAVAQERAVPTKLFASAAEVAAAMARVKAAHKSDSANTTEVLVSAGPYPVQLEYRTGDTPPSVHLGQAELIYVVAGGCTLIEGGTLLGADNGPGPTRHGTRITGGTPHKIAKGDYVLVPPDAPHWYTKVDREFASVTLHMPMKAQ